MPVKESTVASSVRILINGIHQFLAQLQTLIEQNPPLTKALFQAHIMLGMVQPPQAVPNIQPPPSQPTQRSQQTTVQHQSFSGPAVKDQKGPPNSSIPSNTVIPGINTQPQPLPLKTPQNPIPHSIPQLNQAPVSQPPQIPIPHHHPSSQPPPHHQPQISTAPMHHMPLQPPLPPQPRPTSSMASFQHQFPPPPSPPQMVGNINYQHGNAPPQHHSQPPPFHTSNKPPNMGPSFSHSQLPLQKPATSTVSLSAGRNAVRSGIQWSRRKLYASGQRIVMDVGSKRKSNTAAALRAAPISSRTDGPWPWKPACSAPIAEPGDGERVAPAGDEPDARANQPSPTRAEESSAPAAADSAPVTIFGVTRPNFHRPLRGIATPELTMLKRAKEKLPSIFYSEISVMCILLLDVVVACLSYGVSWFLSGLPRLFRCGFSIVYCLHSMFMLRIFKQI